MNKKTFALVGTGGRASMFIEAIAQRFPEHNELVAVCDVSKVRMEHYNKRLREQWNAEPVPVYGAEDFDKMLETRKPDAVVITSMDSTHHDYIIRALEHGCDAITEKPMTVDAD